MPRSSPTCSAGVQDCQETIIVEHGIELLMEFNGIARRLDPARTYVLGRDPQSDMEFQEAVVSWRHARIYWNGKSWVLQDLGSTNGTYTNGRCMRLADITHGAVSSLGSEADGPQLRFNAPTHQQNGHLKGGGAPPEAHRDSQPTAPRSHGQAVRVATLTARRLTVKVKCGKSKRTLLNKVSFAVPPKALIAVIGPSGSGKSTLLRALTGHQRDVRGEVLYENQNLHERFAALRQRIGIVPQHDILHLQLTVRTALRYAARLRFPRDTDAAERDRRVEKVLSELKLDAHAGKRIAALSGGQQKRVSVAMELLTRPSLMFLDEPTSGLDPGMDRDVMQLLRRLADDGRTIIVVTHSVRELELCDKVLVLAPRGSVAYYGPPEAALEFFGYEQWADVFSAFEKEHGYDWSGRWRESGQHLASLVTPHQTGTPAGHAAHEGVHPPKPPLWTAQLFTLVRRYLAVVASDKGFVGMMVLLPVVLGLANTVIPADFGLRKAPHGKANVEAGTVLVSLVISMCFIGTTNSVRELVKERAIYARERAAGLSRSAYLMSKITVLGLITGLQGIVLCALSFAPRELPAEGVVVKSTPVLEMTFVITLLGFTSMMCGLVISALVKTAEKTMPLLVVFSVAQYMFSGIVFKLFDNPGVEHVARLMPSRWAVAAEGVTLDLGQVLGPQDKTAPSATDPLWRHTFGQWLTDTGVLLGAAIVCSLLTIRFLRRHEPEVVRKR
ncbi:ABC transporter ATP-binding protein [Streptomyces lunaelactis]|uniref:ABC transporter ATP-binding protein n=3 Tax=Streptomyces lunaelactis TaxID=1535768 RepID=A0A2R4TD41_9ACTN|nr:ABC transporter ATP-binding protein [Streptomyces lunaelactis]NUK85465.1 ATP-binding cassette domain-containing protein [Streptomyces lunaelactis]